MATAEQVHMECGASGLGVTRHIFLPDISGERCSRDAAGLGRPLSSTVPLPKQL